MAPHIINLALDGGEGSCFLSWSLYPRGRSFRRPLNRRMCGHYRRSGRFREGKTREATNNVTFRRVRATIVAVEKQNFVLYSERPCL